jgi:hypothetical protein
MKKLFTNTVVVAACLSAPVDLMARGRDREGFNFGASFGYETASDRNFSSNVSATKANVESSGSTVSPYFGYVMGEHFNLGISAIFNSTSVKEDESNAEFRQRVERNKQISTKALNAFTRFLFGGVMYFELGAGIYDQGMSIKNAYVSDMDGGAFSGHREQYSIRGLGTGYHMGGGFEVPMSRGFFFTSSYVVRVYNLRNYRGSGDLGGKVGFNQKRDISFGLSHYVN